MLKLPTLRPSLMRRKHAMTLRMHRPQPRRLKSDMAASQASSATALSAAQADADQSRWAAARRRSRAAQQAETDKAAMRAKLSEQLNSILQTRDSARGLIVSMSDVLFDTGKYSLKPGAREKLAKVAGILLAYPGTQHRSRRLYRQRRRRCHEPNAVGESCRIGARLPGAARRVDEFGFLQRLRQHVCR